MTDTTTIPLSTTKWPPQAMGLEHRGRSSSCKLWEIRRPPRPTTPPSSPPSLRWSWIRKIRRRCTIGSRFLSVIMVTLQDKPFLIYIYLTSPSVWWAPAWRWGGMFGGTVKRWWKGKECFVYPLQSLTLKLNVPIKFITTALLSPHCTLGWRESRVVGVRGGGGHGGGAVRRVVFIWKLDLIYLSK